MARFGRRFPVPRQLAQPPPTGTAAAEGAGSVTADATVISPPDDGIFAVNAGQMINPGREAPTIIYDS